MRFERTDAFSADFRSLPPVWRERFRAAIPEFNSACEAWVQDPSTAWPASLRVRPMRGAPGIWEMTWSFAGPDGRATFEWVRFTDERDEVHTLVRWRRIGTHGINENP